ncbi:oligosaccharide flippase family protein [Trujillonella humicola]|uniref:oligosaccharide flippase family protein n=1 Tax=Trujillonella humicola TaxID=3383699 RepID=UPI003905A1B7
MTFVQQADGDRPPSAPTAKVVAKGALWNYAAQIATVIVQVAYAAVTSRLVGAEAFGVFGAAVTSAALINLLATAGLPQIVGRMQTLHESRLRGLLIYAGGVGIIAAVVLILTAPGWARLWGLPDVAGMVRLLAITSFLAPLFALGTGLLLRLGRFRVLAVVTFFGNAAGMAVGVVVVAVTRWAASLAIAAIVAQFIIVVTTLGIARDGFRGRTTFGTVLRDVKFSGKTAFSGVLSYTAGNVGKIGVSQAFGPVALGNWNRAEALTTTPFYQLQAALIQAVYPEFRHDIGGHSRTARVWSDLIGVIAWICLPLGAAVAVVSPVAIPLVLGEGWEQAGRFAPWLAMIGGIQAVVFLLVSGLEALGRFRWVWTGHAIAIVVNVIGAVLAVSLGTPTYFLVGILAGLLGMHVFHVVMCVRAGLVEAKRVATHYLGVAAFAGVVALTCVFVIRIPALLDSAPWSVVGGAALLVLGSTALWHRRRVLPPLVLARSYGLVK